MKKIYGYNSGFGDTLHTHLICRNGKYQILILKMDVGKLRKILTKSVSRGNNLVNRQPQKYDSVG